MIINKSVLCQKVNCVNLDLYVFGKATVNSDWTGFVKAPPFSRLYYVVEGKAEIEYKGGRITMLPGNWYLLPAGLSFTFRCNSRMEHLYFHITLSSFDKTDMLSKFTIPVTVVDDTNPYAFYENCLKDESLFTALTLKEKLYDTILKLMNISHNKPEIAEVSQCVQKAIEFINNNISKKIDLATVAKYAHVSKCTLTNKFKKDIRVTIHDYIQRQKMFMAEQMLKDSQLSVAQISEQLGFTDQFYFSRCFKQNFGVSPREYRNAKIN